MTARTMPGAFETVAVHACHLASLESAGVKASAPRQSPLEQPKEHRLGEMQEPSQRACGLEVAQNHALHPAFTPDLSLLEVFQKRVADDTVKYAIVTACTAPPAANPSGLNLKTPASTLAAASAMPSLKSVWAICRPTSSSDSTDNGTSYAADISLSIRNCTAPTAIGPAPAPGWQTPSRPRATGGLDERTRPVTARARAAFDWPARAAVPAAASCRPARLPLAFNDFRHPLLERFELRRLHL